MLQTILNLFKRPKPQPFNELPPIPVSLETVLDAVRTEMNREEIAKDVAREYGKMGGRPRKWDFHDMEVGECRRYPRQAQKAVYAWAHNNGVKFTMKNASNGLWVRRVA